ncbi:MAG: hypothetical protein H6686_10360 [Fibrobacteria bacterium]|nr:hypothetical protein [Fibrobacteria bacterium]
MKEQDPVKTLIKHVGRGKTLSRDLSQEQAREAARRILSGEFSPAQLGAFLQAMRIKETDADELVGFAEGCGEFLRSETVSELPTPGECPLVVNLAFDTARKGGILTVLACALIRKSGLADPLIIWEPPTLFPQAASMATTLEAAQANPWLATGLCPMVPIETLVPAWRSLRDVRRQLGFRSILNTAEKLLRPWPEAPVVVGVSHDTFTAKLCEVLYRLGASRGAVVQGHHGTVDLGFGEKPTSVHVWQGVRVEPIGVSMADLVPDLDPSILLQGRLAEWPALVRDLRSPIWPAIRAQAAFLLSVASGATLPEALRKIQVALSNLPGEPS